ncbi:hypothetical protein [Cupriavidus sp. UYPR2.512]|uniref:hypothetical protein n=1 Tax=Cupriavidus sp. UYPR2.512 TaxID=1080187 RepID=UPI00036173A1|nr:hypothetical protein [Cupriavidus sp. UYPR2.512]UIF89014.1 hypothetical protein KAF44_27875 [Cupriavidus necator]
MDADRRIDSARMRVKQIEQEAVAQRCMQHLLGLFFEVAVLHEERRCHSVDGAARGPKPEEIDAPAHIIKIATNAGLHPTLVQTPEKGVLGLKRRQDVDARGTRTGIEQIAHILA